MSDRMFMETGNMEDPILKMLSIGGSRPRYDEAESYLQFRRLKGLLEVEKGQVKWSEGTSEAEDEGSGNQYRSQQKVGKVLYYGLSHQRVEQMNSGRRKDFQ